MESYTWAEGDRLIYNISIYCYTADWLTIIYIYSRLTDRQPWLLFYTSSTPVLQTSTLRAPQTDRRTTLMDYSTLKLQQILIPHVPNLQTDAQTEADIASEQSSIMYVSKNHLVNIILYRIWPPQKNIQPQENSLIYINVKINPWVITNQ